jgi:hypothetical protein
MFWGFCGSLVAAGVAYAFKPDTRYVFFPPSDHFVLCCFSGMLIIGDGVLFVW